MPRTSTLKTCADQTGLFFLHGFTGSGQDWQPYTASFSQKYLCLAPDLPGHGQHRGEIPDFQTTVAELKAQLLQGEVQQWILVGYSLGGRLALALAMEPDLRERLLAWVLISSSPGLKTENERRERQQWEANWAERFRKADLNETFEAWYAQPLFGQLRHRPEYAAFKSRRLENSGARLAEALLQLGSGSQPLLWQALPNVHLPGLCLCGADDPRYVGLNREMVTRLPDAEMEILPGVAHALHVEAPSETYLYLDSFVEKHRALLK